MWITGNWASVAAGAMINFMDTRVVGNNAHWTIHDADAGTNAKVYKCEDAPNNCLFYVLVSDNQADFAAIQLWAGWNAVTHVGVGQSIVEFGSGQVFRVRRYIGAWALSLLDRRLIYIDMVNGTTWYCGQPRRFDESKNIVLAVVESTGTTRYNNLAFFTNNTSGGCRFLFDESGNRPYGSLDGGPSNSTSRLFKDHLGMLRFPGEAVIAGVTSGLSVGTLEGVIDGGGFSSPNNVGPSLGETVEIDGTDWVWITGSSSTKYWSLVRKA